MIKQLRSFLSFLLVLTSLTLNIFTDLPKADAATSCTDSKGTFSQTTSNGYTTVTFTATDTLSAITNYNTSTLFATCTWTAPAGLTAVEILIVGGGGGGGAINQAGGGGGGGVLYNPALSISGGNEYIIKVGAGGSGGGGGKRAALTNVALTPSGNTDGYGRTGANGGLSSFNTFEAQGGGGGSGGGTDGNRSPNSGGSGGGGAGYKNNSLTYVEAQSGSNGTQTDPDGATSGWSAYGNSGSAGYNNANAASSIRSGGGGGGAFSAGSTPTTGAGGIGGDGITLIGISVGGGGAGIAFTTQSSPLAGTAGSGGGGCSTGLPGCANGSGTNGTGGGGGATTSTDSGTGLNNGGSGIVVIRYGAATPVISSNPSNLTRDEGGSATFSVTSTISDSASGGNLSYKWQRSINSGSSWTDISGESSNSITISNLTTSMSGYQYRAELTNTRNGVTTSINSNAATLTIKSTDATLSNLQYTPSGGNLTTVDGFTPTGTSYSITLLSTVSSVTIKPTTNFANATVTVNGNSVTRGNSSSSISLSIGNNAVSVVVTSESGNQTQSISINVIRQTTTCSPASSSDSTYTRLTFSGSVCQWSVPTGVTVIDVLVVGGGGGGGYDSGGGGGGGGYAERVGLSVTPGTLYFPSVGSGGAGSGNTNPRTSGTQGNTSSFDSITATGGTGGGPCNWNTVNCQAGNIGGNSGLGSRGTTNSSVTRTSGDGFCSNATGGCSRPAQNGTAGFSSSVAGFTVGGGGAGGGGAGATGGAGGGGNSGASGTDGTGGGGGGGLGNSNGATGGSGTVVVRYLKVPTLSGTRVAGTVKVGQTLSIVDTTTTGSISATTFQWQASADGSFFSNINSATSSTYTLTNTEHAKYIRAIVTVSNSSGRAIETTTATATTVIYANPTISAVTISGTAQVAETLTATTVSVVGSGITTTYQWSTSSTLNGTYSNISGATSNSYFLTATELSNYVRVTATVTNDGGSAATTSTAVLINSASALNPTFDTPTATADGFTVQILNYSPSYSWTGTATSSGAVVINGSGLVTVSGVAPGTSSVATIATTRTGYNSGSATVTKTSLLGSASTPSFSSPTPTADGFTVSVTNYDSNFTYSLTLTNGASAAIDANGLITVSSLTAGSSSALTVTTSRSGYTSGVGSVTGSTLTVFTATFFANNGSGSMSPQTSQISTALNSNSFTRTNYNFVCWNTSSDGSGNTYSDGASFNFSSNISLYAIWIAIPNITSQPSSVNKYAGNSATFTVTAAAADGGILSYQWQKNGVNIFGAISDSLTINSISSGSAGDYQVIITNTKNGSTSTRTSSTATLTYLSATVLTSPTAPTVTANSGSTTSVKVTFSTDPLASSYTAKVYSSGTQIGSDYLLFRSGATITGLSPSTTYTVTLTAVGDGSLYADSSESSATSVTTNAAAAIPIISVHPQSATKLTRQSLNLSIIASSSDGGVLTYQWKKDGVSILGATYDSYTVTSLTTDYAGSYTVVVTNAKNGTTATATSNNAVLTVNIATYSVTYSAPDASSGSVPTDSSSPYTFNSTFTLLANTGSLTRTGYVFAGWQTASDATVRLGGSSYQITTDTTFIAVWTRVYQLTFDANGGSGTMTDLDGPSVTIPSNTFTRTGYTFKEWNTSPNGTGDSVTVNITVSLTQAVKLYAIWNAISSNLITFSTVPTQTYGQSLDLSSYVSASSGLTVIATSNTTRVCTISGLTLTAIGAGTCSITASQPGDGSNAAATNVTNSFTVNKKSLTITVGDISANFGSTISNPTYTQSGLVSSLGDVIATPTYYYSGTSSTYYGRSTTKPTAVGSYLISMLSLSLSSGSIGNYQVTFVSGNLSIASVTSSDVSAITLKRASGDTSSNLITNFDNSRTSYSVYVAAEVSAVVASITRPNGTVSSAQVKINDSGWRKLTFKSNDASTGALPLPSSTNTLKISTISNDKGSKEFTITIYRDTKTAPTGGSAATPAPTTTATPADNAISSVRFLVNNPSGNSSGMLEVDISPTFSRTTYAYTATFANTQSAALMKADFTASGVTLKLKINNGAFTSIPNTGFSSTISLNVGSNTAILRVTSSDASSVDYTFTLNRSAPLSGLTPTFGSTSAITGGFTVKISNYSNSYIWSVSASNGTASIDNSGLVTVSGATGSSTITVISRRSGYANGRSTFTYP